MISRIHISHKEIKKIKSIRKQQIGFKPRGLWYGINMAWVEWCTSVKFDHLEKILFVIF